MRIVFWIAIVCLCVATETIAQVEVAQKEEVPPYNIDAISFASNTPGQSRLDVFIQIPYENLAFIRKGESYLASYEMTIDVLDSTGRLFNEKLWTEEVRAETFDQSVSSQAYSLVQRTFEIPPGRYTIITIMRDSETRQNLRLTRQLTVSDYSSSPFSLSDIMIVNRMNVSGGKKTIVPNVSPNVGITSDAFYIFFEVYNGEKLDSTKLVVDIVSDKKNVGNPLTQVEHLVAGRNQAFIRIENSVLPVGDYTLYVRAFPLGRSGGSDTSFLATTSRAFVVRLRGLPRGVKDITTAIEQCVYLAKDSEMDNMREAKTPEEKQKLFMEFWKKRDPNPNTPRNEKMEEYFQRVEYANKTFKHYTEGWRTDMGMVYIIFGAPNNVDRHPFDVDAKPYEIWAYYELNHSFTFVDQTGFGDYRLTTPIWDVWQRPRD